MLVTKLSLPNFFNRGIISLGKRLLSFIVDSKYNTGLKRLSELGFYGDLVYKFRNIVGTLKFSNQFSKIVICCNEKGITYEAIKQSACLAVDPITIEPFVYLHAGGSGFSLYDGPVWA